MTTYTRLNVTVCGNMGFAEMIHHLQFSFLNYEIDLEWHLKGFLRNIGIQNLGNAHFKICHFDVKFYFECQMPILLEIGFQLLKTQHFSRNLSGSIQDQFRNLEMKTVGGEPLLQGKTIFSHEDGCLTVPC